MSRRWIREVTLASALLGVSCAGTIPVPSGSAPRAMPATTAAIRPPRALVLRPTPPPTPGRGIRWPWSASAAPARPARPVPTATPGIEEPEAPPTIAILPTPAAASPRPTWGSSLPTPRPRAASEPPEISEPAPREATASLVAPVALPTTRPAEPTPVATPPIPLPSPVMRLPSPPPAPTVPAIIDTPLPAPAMRRPSPAPTARSGFSWPWIRKPQPPRALPGRSLPPPEPSGGIIWPWSSGDTRREAPAVVAPEPTWTPARGMTAPLPTPTPATRTRAPGAPVRVTTAAPPRAPTWTPRAAVRTATPEPTPTPMSEARARPDALTFKIPLSSLADVENLRARPHGLEFLSAARRNPDAPISVQAYVTASDIRSHHADASNLSDEIVIRTARYLADRGIDPNRISGKGMGIDETIGRAVVITIDLGESPGDRPPRPSEIAQPRGRAPSRA